MKLEMVESQKDHIPFYKYVNLYYNILLISPNSKPKTHNIFNFLFAYFVHIEKGKIRNGFSWIILMLPFSLME